MNGGLSLYVPASVLFGAFVFKMPGMLRARHDPLLRSVCLLLLMGSAVFCFAAPPTIAAVNRWTGVPNFSAPLTYCVLSVFSASCILLIVNWRGGPADWTRRASLWFIGAYSVVTVLLIVLFALGDAPVERLRDLDTYYANTPFIREMIVLYLLAHTVAGTVMAVLCRRWSLEVHGWLRAGVVLIVIGYVLDLGFDTAKFAAVVARWTGHNWDTLSTDAAPPLASLAAMIVAVGFITPLTGQRLTETWRNWASYHRLGALWDTLRRAAPRPGASVPIPWWSAPSLRLTQREADIHDALLALEPYLDPAVRESAWAAALAAGVPTSEARALAEAAAITAAITTRAADSSGEVLVAAEARDTGRPPLQRDLVRISRALRQSPVAHALRRGAARPESSPHERIR
ncbi:MAB_1171c family putative transporter [Streptomyces sp. NPDC002004]